MSRRALNVGAVPDARDNNFHRLTVNRRLRYFPVVAGDLAIVDETRLTSCFPPNATASAPTGGGTPSVVAPGAAALLSCQPAASPIPLFLAGFVGCAATPIGGGGDGRRRQPRISGPAALEHHGRLQSRRRGITTPAGGAPPPGLSPFVTDIPLAAWGEIR